MRLALLWVILAAACGAPLANGQDSPPVGVATETTRLANARVAETLPLADPHDLENATRGLLAQIPGGIIRADDGRIVWDAGSYAFLDGPACRDGPASRAAASAG